MRRSFGELELLILGVLKSGGEMSVIDASSQMTDDELNELSLLIDAKKKKKHGS